MTKTFSFFILIFSLFISPVMSNSSDVLWQTSCGGTLSDVGTDIIIVDDSIFISGYTRSFGSTGINSVIGKFNLEGKLLWLNAYDLPGDDIILRSFTIPKQTPSGPPGTLLAVKKEKFTS